MITVSPGAPAFRSATKRWSHRARLGSVSPTMVAISRGRSRAMVVTATPPALITASQAAARPGVFGPRGLPPVPWAQHEVLGQHPGELVSAEDGLAVGPGFGWPVLARRVKAGPVGTVPG